MLVSWDDYSQYIGKIKNVPNHQQHTSYIYIYMYYICDTPNNQRH